MKLNRKRIFFWVQILIIIYCGVGIALYYLQDKLIFHPEKLAADYVFKFNIPFEEMLIPVNKTDTISLVKFKPQGAVSKGLVVYFHGNMYNVGYYEPYAAAFTRYGYEVWMPDYPGYGKSTGELTEKKMYEQAWQVQKLAMTKYHSDSIILYGRSLGTGIASYVASVSKCKRLLLETPYYSMLDLCSHYAWMYPMSLMANYKIPTWKFLEDVKVPVTIFHGTADNTIPYSCASKLKEKLKPGDQFITIEGGDHNDLGSKKIFNHVRDSILLQ